MITPETCIHAKRRAPFAPQDGVRFHTINRATGRARIWALSLVFCSYYIVNCFDTHGGLNLNYN